MRTCHWSLLNGSGMHQVAASMARAELAIGVESRCLDPFDKEQKYWDWALDADVHISHTHIPERIGAHSFKKSCTKPYRWVFPIHGTPEHVFEMSIADAADNKYNGGTSYAHHQVGMQNADAVWAFAPRHRDLYDLATDKHTTVDHIPMGIDVAFWQSAVSSGKFQGKPSFLCSENQHPFKWAVYIIRMWPWIRRELDESILHVLNLPANIHRFVDTMGARYGSIYGAIYGAWSYDHPNLAKILKSVDYYISPVRYGDFNRMSLEAGASGAKVISFPGNPYADYWMQEGDDRYIARDLIAIGRGDLAPRADKVPVPTERDMGEATITCYERLLDRPRTAWALGGMLDDAIPEAVRQAIATVNGGRELEIPAPRVPTLTLLTEHPVLDAVAAEEIV